MKRSPAKKFEEGWSELRGKLDKRTWLLLAGLNLLLIASSLYLILGLKQPFPALGTALVMAAFDGMIIRSFRSASGKEEEALQKEFVQIFAYFAIYIRDGLPVYHALEECLHYASEPMEKRLRGLLDGIDHDKTVAPFVAFGDSFHSMEIRQLLISIYRMVDEGGNESYIRQFSVLFDSLQATKKKEELERTDSRLGSLGMLAMGDSALIMLLVTIGIVQIIGGYVNGI
jgi:hypothetical protein